MEDLRESVILVDENNHQIWTMPKLEAHKKWLLHRAFSLFIFNEKKELLLQQRALKKYHCWGIWTNTVCSHQRDWEKTLGAAKRRLQEELGISWKNIKIIDAIVYKETFPNGITEHEYDYVLIWKYCWENISPDPTEVMNYNWISLVDLKKDIRKKPEKYSIWVRIIMEKGILEK